MRPPFSFQDDGLTHLLLNPRRDVSELELYEKLQPRLQEYPDHIWLQSSGSSSAVGELPKLIGLSKAAFRASAWAVNRHLSVADSDVWGLALPEFHVGGLAIFARAEETGIAVIDLNSISVGSSFAATAQQFREALDEHQVSLLSLVPTQVFDLVGLRKPPPPTLRAVIVGGAALTDRLYQEARSLGWPLLPSFGMTEVCSQIATAELTSLNSSVSPPLRILDHCYLSLDSDGHLQVQSDSLLTGQFLFQNGEFIFEDPKVQTAMGRVYVSKDRAEINGPYVRPLGRDLEFVKILGEGVNVAQVRDRFFYFWTPEEAASAFVLSLPDERRGARLVLVTESLNTVSHELINQRINEWNDKAFPVERIDAHQIVDQIPRTALGKVALAELIQEINRNS